ncbi:iron-containing alcohol dehydrogenase [Arcobacter sp. CECT 8985]|uniref:iron-containing alcohol dehydrogenase n=1 Tax=Arcobacter sp. CECT 8985 TaxID=1935424 RepID=UPI00100A8B10|nr:iron-containing alcohol dehydrogenase [Arcobacter sp. CECT 8985]RXJ87488.1 NADH-dependent alcohol dehydrogenase [Arcobacter sp. CECT 8985]
MRNFSYYNPTRVEFGKNKESNIGKYISQYNIKKVLLVYGSNRIKKDGLFFKVEQSLKDFGIEFIELGAVQSNPLLSKINEGISLAKENKVEAILAVGGGSVLDSSKAIAAGSTTDDDVWDYYNKTKVIKDALLIFDIITLAATGSEMNCVSVATNETTSEKYSVSSPYLYPTVSIVNPELQTTVSRNYLVYSAVDVISHLIEGYFTASHFPDIISSYVETNIKTIIKTTEKLLENRDDYNARCEFAWVAMQAENGSTTIGVEGGQYPNHMIEHAISALYNVPHGAGLSVVMPAWMKWYYKNNITQFDRFAREVFKVEDALLGIEKLEKWFEKIESPTKLSQFNIHEDDLDKISENAYKNAISFGIEQQYTKEVIKEILLKAL